MTQVSTQQQTGVKAVSAFLNSNSVQKKFQDILGQKANGFIASVLSVVNNNDLLQKSDQNSIYTAALMAASLDLPINPNLGLAYIVPYKGKAQFQLGYRGFKQLAQRSGQFVAINDTDVREGELVNHNRLSGEITFDWNQDSADRLKKKVVGYVSYFKLVNGFESTLYMTVEELEAHAKKYSQTYKKYGSGLWKDEFDGMARKTVTKLNLSKNAPLSIDLQRATIADQAVIKDFDPNKNEDAVIIDSDYVDNKQESIDPEKVATEKEYKRITNHIKKAQDIATLEQVEGMLMDDEHTALYEEKKHELVFN
jgi:recombination protein RecT